MSDSLIPPVLNPQSLYKEEAKRDATRIRIYNSILSQIYNKVKVVAKVPGNEKSLVYVVPEFIPGTPRFEMSDAILYIAWNLRNAGYTVSYTHPNLMFISWKQHDAHYRNVESPWWQVLETARSAVLTGDTQPVIRRPTPAPITATAASTEVQKRKTALKKTTEYKPTTSDSVPSQTGSNPGVVQAMYAQQPAAPPPRLPGQLSEKHVSFV